MEADSTRPSTGRAWRVPVDVPVLPPSRLFFFCSIINSHICSQGDFRFLHLDACTGFHPRSRGPPRHQRIINLPLALRLGGCDKSLTVSAAVVRVARDSSGHCRHQSVLDGHLPHPGHILSHPAHLRRQRQAARLSEFTSRSPKSAGFPLLKLLPSGGRYRALCGQNHRTVSWPGL